MGRPRRNTSRGIETHRVGASRWVARGLWAPGACNGEHRPADEASGCSGDHRTAHRCAGAPLAPSIGVTITRAPGTVRRGATATVAARTTSGAQCTIVVHHL